MAVKFWFSIPLCFLCLCRPTLFSFGRKGLRVGRWGLSNWLTVLFSYCFFGLLFVFFPNFSERLFSDHSLFHFVVL